MRESLGRLHYNLGAAPVAAKGTMQDYLAHLKAIPVQIMTVKPVFSGVVKAPRWFMTTTPVFDFHPGAFSG
jgi:hypothetical protein